MSSTTPSDFPLRIMLVANDALARMGLAALLESLPDCRVVGQSSLDDHLLESVRVFQPDVILWDLGWSASATQETAVRSHVEHMTELAADVPPIVALIASDDDAQVVWAAGARGLLPREANATQLALALRAVVHELDVFAPTFARALMRRDAHLPEILTEALTARELEVLQSLAEGLPNKTIAQRLHISEHTVKFHVNAILNKLGAQSRTEAVVHATRAGLIRL